MKTRDRSQWRRAATPPLLRTSIFALIKHRLNGSWLRASTSSMRSTRYFTFSSTFSLPSVVFVCKRRKKLHQIYKHRNKWRSFRETASTEEDGAIKNNFRRHSKGDSVFSLEARCSELRSARSHGDEASGQIKLLWSCSLIG